MGRNTDEVPLFRPSTPGWPPPGWPPGLERARATVGGRSVPLADLPRYRITQSLRRVSSALAALAGWEEAARKPVTRVAMAIQRQLILLGLTR
jgi:hypothetical protein